MHITKSSFWRAGWHILLSLAVLLPGVLLPSVPAAHSRPRPTTNTITTLKTAPENITSPHNELTYTEVLTLPQFLPYNLGYAIEVADVGSTPAATVVNVALPDGTMPEDTLSQQLTFLFYYDTANLIWQKLPTQRAFEDGVWHLQAPAHAPGIFAVALATTNDMGGDYAEPWQPTVSDAQVDLFTGAVQWTYPLDIPGGRGGLGPNLSLTYHSGIVDETREGMNPQTPGVGLGWTLGTAYIEREIQRDDRGTPQVFQDQRDKFRLVLNGVSSDLICVDDQTPCQEFRTQDERYWRIQRRGGAPNESQYPLVDGIQGEYWQVTTPDGIQYRFGWSGDPDLYPADNEGQLSAWYMLGKEVDVDPANVIPYIWRWNLDRIIDPQGNVASFFYTREYNDTAICNDNPTNPYLDCWYAVQDIGTTGLGAFYLFTTTLLVDATPFQTGYGDHILSRRGYVRGGHLLWVSYTRGDGHDPYRVDIQTQTQTDGRYYPHGYDSRDSHDQVVVQYTQTFWSKKLITDIKIRGGEALGPPEERPLLWTYTLAQRYAGADLVLESLQRQDGEATTLPPTTFIYHELVSYRDSQGDGDKYKHWLAEIRNGYGGGVAFNLSTPDSFQNGQTANPHADSDGHYWYRYRVRKVSTWSGVATVPGTRTHYQYLDTDGTQHDGTWQDEEFRGHPRVRVLQYAGDHIVSFSDHYFYQGLGETPRSGCAVLAHDAPGMTGRQYLQVDYRVDAGSGQTEIQRTATTYRYCNLGAARRFVSVQTAQHYPDGANGPLSQTDYQYDDYGNVTQETHYGDTASAGDEVVIVRDYVYNPTAWIINTPWQETLQTLAGAVQRQTRYAYDGQAVGQPPTAGLVTEVSQGRDDWQWITTQTQYDDWGNPEIITDALGHATHTAYDPVSHQFPVRVTNALGHATAAQWDFRLGVPEVITDANGAVTHLDYDSFGRVIAVTPPGDAAPSVKYTYPGGDALTAPFVVTAETRIDAYLTTPQYQTAWTVYDGLGRVIQTQMAAENDWQVVQSTAYDALGRPVTATLPYTVSAGGGVYHPPNWDMLPKTVTTYDELGRIVQVQAADGSITRKDYRAWQELVLDAEGHQTSYENDGLGRLTTVREYYGAYPAPDWNAAHPAVTTYHYDPQGNLTQVTDALGHVTRIGYDPLGRKTWMDDPSMGYWTYRYDDAGNLIEQTDAENQTLTFQYDALNRLTHKRHAGALLAEYDYDQGVNGIGRRTTMTDTSGATTWQYDVQGRALTETKTIAGWDTFTTAWAYDAAGRVITITYPTGEAVHTSYNRRGLPETVAGLDAYLTAATYNAAGQPLRQTWGNTRQTSYAYESDTLRLQHLQVSGDLLALAYTYDQVGNINTLTDVSNVGQVQTFTYDARDRLLTAQTDAVGQGQYHETYGYDLMGNIITRTVGEEAIDYTYGRRHGLTLSEPTTPATNTYQIYLPLVARNFDANLVQQPFAVVATSAGFRAGYDRNGNMLARVEVSGTETITYTQAWDVENRLSIVTNMVSGDVTRFVYDGDGNRVWREQPDGSVTAYLGAVEVTISGTERLTTSYYFASGQRIAMREGVTLTYLHGDHLGSASLATDENGAQVNTLRYTPFGEIRYGDAPTDFRFTGQREEDFGWYDYGARLYSPSTGKFVSADIVVPDFANPQSLNRYAYVFNNPLRYIDPTGYDPLDDLWQKEFEKVHDRSPDWYDRLIRLFSIAYPDEWDWSLFYNNDGSYIEGSIEKVFRDDLPSDRTWEGVPQALKNMAGWYDKDEGRLLARDIGTLFGGLKDRLAASGWEAISHRANPVQPWVYVGSEGLSPWLTGDSDADSNIHHWAWGLAMGSEYALGGSIINTGREMTQFNWDFGNTWSDIMIGNAGASLGCSLRVLGPYDIVQQFNFHMMQWDRLRGKK